MKVVAFNGSPRKKGNTQIMLQTALKPLSDAGIETEIIHIGGQMIRGCTGCGWCREKQCRRCVIATDIVNDCIAKMIEADAIILGSPVYFADMTAEMKALIDRSGYVCRGNGALLNRKIGAAVAVQRRGGALHTMDSMNHFFLISGMIVPGSTYWNMGFGSPAGAVAEDAEALATMTALGENITWLLQKINPLPTL